MNDNNDIQEAKAPLRLPKIIAGIPGETKSRQTNTAKAEPLKPVVTSRPLGELLDAIAAILRRYVVFPMPEQVSVIAAWVAHTWVFEAFDYTAYLFVFSAAKRSGKSRVLEVIELVAKNARLTPGASSAALMRSVDESDPPTMLLDEVDTIYSNKGGDAEAENTRRFLNAGYKRGAKFLKCVGQGADISVKELPAFCPKALAGIDRCLPDTVLDRCLPIELVRQSREEKAERFRDREVRAIAAPLRAELEALPKQPRLIDALRDARPKLPEELNDRVMDITEPLIAVADLAGGEWPQRIRSALIRLYSQEEDADIGVKLLGDMKSIFELAGVDKIPTEEILEELVAIEDRPWALMFEDALKNGRLQTAASKLAKKLKPYKTPDCEKIKPRPIKLSDGSVPRGYYKADFLAAWERYLPPVIGKSATSATSATYEGRTVAATDSGSATSIQGATKNAREGSGSSGSSASTGMREERDKYNRLALDCWRRHVADHSKSPFPNMSDEEWAEYDARFNASKIIYPGNWVRLTQKETVEDWQATLRQALEKPCEVCGELMGGEEYLWYHRTRHVGRCPNCQETDWFADGYEIDEFGIPSCWSHRHTREERIAERTRNQIQKAACYQARKAGLEYTAMYKALLARESKETRRMIEQLYQKERTRKTES
jgi:hypothetical protein